MQVGRKTIVLVVLLGIALSLPFLGRTWNLFMHILGAIVFLGNIMVTAVWMFLARRASEPAALRFAVRGVVATDIFFATPGVILVLFNGGIMSSTWFETGQSAWIMLSLGLFILSGVVWFGFLIPIQRRMARLVEVESGGGVLPEPFYVQLKKWNVWGGVATLLPFVTLALMVFKPSLW